jgi:hypothetical protein
VPAEGGFAVVLHRFDTVAVAHPEFARRILDIFAWASWDRAKKRGRSSFPELNCVPF